MNEHEDIIRELQARFPGQILSVQPTCCGMPVLWVGPNRVRDVLRHLKTGVAGPYRMLYDLTAIDERARVHRHLQNVGDFTVCYHLLSFDRNSDVMIKVPLASEPPSVPTITDLWANANWYEREAWDMFGIVFQGHPHLRRILMPDTWQGHPLRKDHPARATDMPPFQLPDDKQFAEQAALEFKPEDWGLKRSGPDTDFLFLNLGPQHPGTHGPCRFVVQLDGEEIVDAVPDIGYHHRGAEKMGERQTWHTYIPYTDRIDYLGGAMNEFAYVQAVEKLAGIGVPDRVKVMRVLVAELYRIASHLVWYGTFATDLGQMTPVFLMFTDREHVFDITEAICGGRMHPNWFRIGGVADDLPEGWDVMVAEFIKYLRPRLDDYDKMVMRNPIVKARSIGIGEYSTGEAIEWGATGPALRATGLEWDFRKKRPYSAYDQFDFEIPVGSRGDVYSRGLVRVEEIRQSLRIVEQCLKNMPAGEHMSEHPLATPPLKKRTMHNIETLITHFVGVSWGPVIPPGESFFGIEATKGNNGYYLVSDGDTVSYRTRIRTPSFAHLQMVPMMCRGLMVQDLIAILGSIDYVLADVDR